MQYIKNLQRRSSKSRGKTRGREKMTCQNNQHNHEQEEPKNNRVAIYSRVSSYNQTFGNSLDEQIRQCRERCEMMGWKVCYIFKENGKSGGNLDRPQFQLLMKRAEMGCFDTVVFWKLDRFCRSLVDLINIERELKQFNVSLYSITEMIDTTSPVGRFNFRSLASAAELEREMIKERTRMGMKALAVQHKWPGRVPPLGYDTNKEGRLEIVPEEAKTVRKIFNLYIKTKSMPEVAYRLNKSGILTKKQNPWNSTAVRTIVTNQLYKGIFKVKDFEDYVKEYRILPDRLFEQAEKIRFRHRDRMKSMPIDQKTQTVNRLFKAYQKYLEMNEELD